MMRKNIGAHAILLGSFVWTVVLAASTARDPKVAPTGRQATSQPVGASFSSRVTEDEAKAASAGCITCHTKTDEATMHPSGTVTLGCATCHGGDPKVSVAAGLDMEAKEYGDAKKKAHPQPRVSDLMRGKIHLFSIDNLVVLLAAAGLRVDLKIKTAA